MGNPFGKLGCERMDITNGRLFRFLTINSDDERIVRQSRLLQILVALIAIAGVAGSITVLIDILQGQSSDFGSVQIAGQMVAVFIFTFATFYLLHHGHFLPAVHLFFILLNALILVLLFGFDNIVFSYLLLISVFSIAAVQSIRASAIYFLVTIAAVSLYHYFNSLDPIGSASEFIRIALFLTIPSWFFANDLRNSRDKADRLTKELETSVANYAQRTKQLQHIAEIGRIATASLDQEKLLRNTVNLIQERFGLYFVRVFLLSPDGSRLIVEEASGESGRNEEQRGIHLTVGQVSIVGWVAINRQARIALNVGEDPFYFDDPNLPHTQSEVALPLIARNRLLGVLDVHSRESMAFQEEDISILQVMADQIARGMDNARLFEEISRQADTLTELQTITSLMSQQANIYNALNVVAKRAIGLFNAGGGGVFLRQSGGDKLEFIVNLNESDTNSDQILDPGEGLSGRAFAKNETIIIDDIGAWENPIENFILGNFQFAVAIPLRSQKEPIGVLTLTRNEVDQPFLAEEIQVAELLAAQVSAVIVNNQLIEETRRLAKRERSINQAAAQIRRSLDAKTILETTTDQLGHLLGDKIVKARLFPQQEGLTEENERI